MDIPCSGCSYKKQDTMIVKRKQQRKKYSMNRKRRVAFHQETSKPKQYEKLISFHQNLSTYEKPCKNVSHPANFINFQKCANINEDFSYTPNLKCVQKNERLESSAAPCINVQPLSSKTKFVIKNEREEEQSRQGDTNGNFNFNMQVEPESTHFGSEDEKNNESIQNSGIFVESKMSSNASENVMKIPNEIDETFINITNDPQLVPVPSLQFFKSEFVPSYNTNFPVQSVYVFENLNHSVPAQVINSQAPVYQYVYVPNMTYVTWQNVHYYSDQQVMYTLPGVPYMFYTIQIIPQSSPFCYATYQGGNNHSILSQANQQHCDQNLYQQKQSFDQHQHQYQDHQENFSYNCTATSHEPQAPNESKYSQFESIGEKPMVIHIENTIDRLTKVEDLSIVSEEPLELEHLYTNPCFHTLSRSSTCLNAIGKGWSLEQK